MIEMYLIQSFALGSNLFGTRFLSFHVVFKMPARLQNPFDTGNDATKAQVCKTAEMHMIIL